MDTTIDRSGSSPAVKTFIDLSAEHCLIIATRKSTSGRAALITSASGQTKENGFLIHTAKRDFHSVLAESEGRATERALQSQHDTALAQIEDVVRRACEHYKIAVPDLNTQAAQDEADEVARERQRA
jgi:hypothetical protein